MNMSSKETLNIEISSVHLSLQLYHVSMLVYLQLHCCIALYRSSASSACVAPTHVVVYFTASKCRWHVCHLLSKPIATIR